MLIVLAAYAVQIIDQPDPQDTARPAAVIARTCGRNTDTSGDISSDIVVCGSRTSNEQYRLRPLPEKYVQKIQARLKLPGDAALSLHGDNGRTGDSQAKITLTIPF